jgi:glucose/arabinose dehydrogenase
MRLTTTITLAAVAALAIPAAAFAQAASRAEAVKAVLDDIKLPDGFAIELYALVPGARQIAVAPDGKAVFVGTRSSRVYRVDTSGDRAVSVFQDGLKTANGVCFAPDGTLYVAEIDRVTAYAAPVSAENGRMVVGPGGKSVLVPAGDDRGGGHSARVCRIGPDGGLYVAVGQPYNVPPKEKQAHYKQWGIGGIVRFDRDGANRTVYATGIRNAVGLDFDARGRLWFTDNQVDGMGDDVPPGEINMAEKAGQDFGFPWYGGGSTRTREYAAETPPSDVVFPASETDAHAADLGMSFYRGTAFPERWRGGIFSAQHGSWNRTKPIGARVMFTAVDANGKAGATEVFAEGWKTAGGTYRGRPVDVAELPDGSLLVSDDSAGALYRIRWGR